MKSLWKHVWLTAVAAALLLAPANKVLAQELKPVGVVSIAPINKLLGDIDYLTKTAGVEEAGGVIAIGLPYLAGVDRTKPLGAYVVMEGENPVTVAFVPVKDLAVLLATVKENVGEPKELDGGVMQVGEDPRAAYIKQEGSYAFVAQKPEHLVSLPKDPVKLLGGLETTYSLAVRVNAKNVPASLKEMAIKALEENATSTPLENIDDPAQKELIEKVQANSLKQMKMLVEETEQVTFGWAIEPKGKTTYFEFVFTASEGTKLAQQMATLKDAKTNFAGFLLPEAGFTANFSSKTTDPAEIAQAINMLAGTQAALEKEIDKDEERDEDEKAATKELLNSAMAVAKATIQGGKFDGGAIAIADEEELTFVAGGHVVDAPKLEAAIKKAVAFAQKKHPEELEDVEIKFDSEKHGGIRFHSFTVPVKEEEGQKVFGEEVEVIIAAGDKSAFIAFGTDPAEALKKVIDKSAASPNQAVLPAQMNLALGPFLKFAASVEDNPVTAALAEAAEKVTGNDHLRIHVKAISNGEAMRFEVEEGVIKLIGEGIRNAQGAAGF